MRTSIILSAAVITGAFLMPIHSAQAWGYGHGMLQVSPEADRISGLNASPEATEAATVSEIQNPNAIHNAANPIAQKNAASYSDEIRPQASEDLTSYYADVTRKNQQAAEKLSRASEER